MAKYTIDGTTLSDVADAVRELDGNPDTMTPAQMASRIRAVQPGGADLSVIADDYDTTATYDVGDYCIHEGGLYVCTTAISTAEAWTAGHWEEVTVGDELSDVKSDLTQKYEKPSTGIPASDIASGVIPDVSGFYTKPSGGIPSSDLSSGIQTSLGKADTAYQKPSGGIPASDLASGVIPDVSGKADKVQSSTSGNFASLDSNGNLVDSGHKHSDYLTQHQDISGKADKVQSATSGNFASLDANGNLIDSGHKHSDYLTEHQDLTDYVKNTDYASSSVGGVVKLSSSIGMNSSNQIGMIPATNADVQDGSNGINGITPSRQHRAVFYGLAKAAGDTTQSASSNAVGTYTDDAKIKIQKMLGIYEAPWELISDVTISEDLEGVVVNTDVNGDSFALKKGIICVEAPKTTTGTRDYMAAQGRGVDNNNIENPLNFPNLQWVGATAATLFYYDFDCNGVSPQHTSGIAVSGYNATAAYAQTANYVNGKESVYLRQFSLLKYNNNSSSIPSGTRIRIYGQRYDQ